MDYFICDLTQTSSFFYAHIIQLYNFNKYNAHAE
jgi:hypothetical protein